MDTHDTTVTDFSGRMKRMLEEKPERRMELLQAGMRPKEIDALLGGTADAELHSRYSDLLSRMFGEAVRSTTLPVASSRQKGVSMDAQLIALKRSLFPTTDPLSKVTTFESLLDVIRTTEKSIGRRSAAQKLDTSVTMIQRWVRGGQPMSISCMRRILVRLAGNARTASVAKVTQSAAPPSSADGRSEMVKSIYSSMHSMTKVLEGLCPSPVDMDEADRNWFYGLTQRIRAVAGIDDAWIERRQGRPVTEQDMKQLLEPISPSSKKGRR